MAVSLLKNDAVEYISTAIHRNIITEDDIITEAQICKDLGISRTPVREALVELTTSGIIEKVPHKGYRVRSNSKKSKVDAYTILGALDGLAAKLSISNINEEDIRDMKKNIALADVAIEFADYSAYCQAQDDFHNVYIKKCDNLMLISEIEEIKKRVNRYSYYSENTELLFKVFAEVNEEHKHIVKFFEEGDSKNLQDYISEVHWAVKYEDMIMNVN